MLLSFLIAWFAWVGNQVFVLALEFAIAFFLLNLGCSQVSPRIFSFWQTLMPSIFSPILTFLNFQSFG